MFMGLGTAEIGTLLPLLAESLNVGSRSEPAIALVFAQLRRMVVLVAPNRLVARLDDVKSAFAKGEPAHWLHRPLEIDALLKS